MVAERESQSPTEQPERAPEVEPLEEAAEPSGLLAEHQLAPPAPPPPPDGNPFTTPDHHTARRLRQREILNAQHVHGNAFVQRALAPSAGGRPTTAPGDGARAEEPSPLVRPADRGADDAAVDSAPAPRQAPSALVQRRLIQRQGGGVAKAVKVPLDVKPFKIGQAIPGTPFEFDSVKVGGEASVTAVPPGAGGSKVTMSHEGIAAETGTVWDQVSTPFGDMTVESKAEAQVTNKGGELSVNLIGVKFKEAAFAVKFSFIEIDTDDADIKLASTTLTGEYIPISGKKIMPDGTTLEYEIKGKVDLVFDVDKVKVAEWLAEKFGEDALIEIGAAGSIIAAGVATLAAAYFEAAKGKELAAAVDEARRLVNEFCAAYAGTLDGSGDWTATSEWGYEGEAAANAVIKGNSKDAIIAEAKKKGSFTLKSEAFAVGWPKVKQAAYDSWEESHSVETYLFGDDAPGLHDLKFILEDPRQNRYTEETYSAY